MSDTIKEHIARKLHPLLSVFAQAALGKFAREIEIPEDDDEFAELYAGIQIMLNVINQTITDLKGEIVSRKKAERELIRNQLELSAILENIGDGLIVTDKKGEITMINNAALDMLGWESKKIVGKLLLDAVPMEDEEGNIIPRSERPMQLTLNSGKKMVGNYWYRRYDNSRFATAIIATPLLIAGEIIGSIEVFRDITREQEQDKRKDDFIALSSHEMKTPVTSLKIFTQVLERRLEQKGEKEFASQFKSIDHQLTKLANLINDLLDTSRMRQGKLTYHKKKFFIDSFIREIVENIQRTTETHALIIESQAKQTVFGDRNRVEQVLTNLINNAIKYSPSGKKIIIGATKDKDFVTVSVQDFGMGIPKSEQKEIFGRFYQVDTPRVQTYPGLGLGLFISSKIIERHNGKMWLKSEMGKGSTFFFSLPVRSVKSYPSSGSGGKNSSPPLSPAG